MSENSAGNEPVPGAPSHALVQNGSAERPRRRAVRQAGTPAAELAQSSEPAQSSTSAQPSEPAQSSSTGSNPAMSSPGTESAPIHTDNRDADGGSDRGGNSGRRSSGGRDGNRGGRDGGRNGGNRDGGRDSNRSSQRRSNERAGDRVPERPSDRAGDSYSDRADDRPDARPEEDSELGRRRRGGGRYRDRDRNRRGGRERDRGDSEPAVADDDVLLPVAGIVDILDSYAFIRTSGYLPGSNDVYVAMSQVRKYGLRRGDAVTGSVRQSRDGDRQAKYNPLVRLDTVNGVDGEQAQRRAEFHKLT
ncbi:MAG: transcription termination factor Rho, partial [Mycobacteriales bacterium]